MTRLIITNGDSAIERLRAAGIADEILSWADMLHEGPVPAGLSLEDLSACRAHFLADDLGLCHDRVAADFHRRDALVRSHGDFDRIELWFEHDLFDQLQLIQLLNFFAGEGRCEGLLLVQAADYLGLQPKDAVDALAGEARPITPRQIESGSKAWAAFTERTPVGLAGLRPSEDDLPYLHSALQRLLAELPAPGSGLSLTETRALSALMHGPLPVEETFKIVSEQEPARFLGDVAFFRRLDGLCFGQYPLVAGLPYSARQCSREQGAGYRAYAQSEIAITDLGQAALAGRFDHARQNGMERWLGGTHLTSESLWYWDRNERRLIAP